MRVLAAALLFATAGAAYAATAYLVSSRIGMSVTGRSVYVCTYRYGTATFERTIAFDAGPCPYSIEIQ
jgi:hypothetical protein